MGHCFTANFKSWGGSRSGSWAANLKNWGVWELGYSIPAGSGGAHTENTRQSV